MQVTLATVLQISELTTKTESTTSGPSTRRKCCFPKMRERAQLISSTNSTLNLITILRKCKRSKYNFSPIKAKKLIATKTK
jgi:hypothetical protein